MTTTAPTQAPRKRFRLSLLRLVIALVVVAAIAVAALLGAQNAGVSVTKKASGAWFASYVDVMATPSFPFESPSQKANRHVILSFVVSQPDAPCTASWGGIETLDEAARSRDLDRRVVRLGQQGGEAIVSFGGQRNEELAVGCTSVKELAAAYLSVVERYDLSTIDIDIEGSATSNVAANERRADALALVQKAREKSGTPLAVWLTLPVSPDGLTLDGQQVVRSTLAGGVDLAGINAMTMDFGNSIIYGSSELVAAKQALESTHRQLGILYSQQGTTLTDKTVWSKIGATPMVGQNDVYTEIFTLGNARGLNTFASEHGIGRMSMWSLNRDVSCGSSYTSVRVVSDSCSGIPQRRVSFAKLLANDFPGHPSESSRKVTTAESVTPTSLVDNAATSPYPIWEQRSTYLAGTKIVWHRSVYVAKWWTSGGLPDNPTLNAWETPWTLVGPVLPGEKPIAPQTLPVGTYPSWDGQSIYDRGMRVLVNGIPYVCKWWTQGESPDASSANPDSSPWAPLTAEQIRYVLAPN